MPDLYRAEMVRINFEAQETFFGVPCVMSEMADRSIFVGDITSALYVYSVLLFRFHVAAPRQDEALARICLSAVWLEDLKHPPYRDPLQMSLEDL